MLTFKTPFWRKTAVTLLMITNNNNSRGTKVSDLQWPWMAVTHFVAFFSACTTWIWMNIRLLLLPKNLAQGLVSGIVRFIVILVGVLLSGGFK